MKHSLLTIFTLWIFCQVSAQIAPNLQVIDNGLDFDTEEEDPTMLYVNCLTIGGTLITIYNDTGDENGSTIYSIGKLGGYWDGLFEPVGVFGYATPEGSDGKAILGAYGGTGINDPENWGALGTDGFGVYCNGDQFSTTGAMWMASDANLKQNISTLHSALTIINALKPKTYEYKKEESLKHFSLHRMLNLLFLNWCAM